MITALVVEDQMVSQNGSRKADLGCCQAVSVICCSPMRNRWALRGVSKSESHLVASKACELTKQASLFTIQLTQPCPLLSQVTLPTRMILTRSTTSLQIQDPPHRVENLATAPQQLLSSSNSNSSTSWARLSNGMAATDTISCRPNHHLQWWTVR